MSVKCYNTCEEHDDCIVVFDHTRAGRCPACEEVGQYQSDLEQAKDNEENLRKDFNAASRDLAGRNKQIIELRKKIIAIEKAVTSKE